MLNYQFCLLKRKLDGTRHHFESEQHGICFNSISEDLQTEIQSNTNFAIQSPPV